MDVHIAYRLQPIGYFTDGGVFFGILALAGVIK